MFKTIVDFKMEVKLRKLIHLCPQLRRLLEISLARIKGRGVADVCKVTMAKVENFEEGMHVVQGLESWE